GAIAAPKRDAPQVVTQAPAPSRPAPVVAADTTPAPPADTIRLAAAAPTTEAPAPAPTQEPAPAAQEASAFRIQVVAANSQGAADAAIQRLERLGFSARIAREGGFLKVRAGSYATRAEANAARQRLTADFPGAFVVSD
ncbi:MAG TPA: SPOR domain-containing protein, partial [Gemmatimonadales bacterium]|nr:SPOR domain-containing protein [Gemmatimonadales bacterium]